VNRERNVLLLVVGTFALWLGTSDVALNYVRPQVRTLVLVAGAVVAVLALLPPHGLLSRRPPAADPHHHGRLGVGWLLAVPPLVLALVAPAPLGANAVRSRLVRPRSAVDVYPALGRPVDGAVRMSMAEFYARAVRDRQQSLAGVTVRLVGFVGGTSDGGIDLDRFVIYCCAADAEAVEIRVTGLAGTYRANTWLAVEGTWAPVPYGSEATPVLRATAARQTKRPSPPYEYTVVWTS
jgi:putative membrane protein